MKNQQALTLRQRIDTLLPTWSWWILGLASFFIFQNIMAWMGGLYEATLHPASIIAGQTTFNGDAIKGFYASMIEQGTLTKYVQVQIYDYILMTSMFAWLAGLCVAVYRSLPNVKTLKNIAWTLAILCPLAPMFDALENIVSFFMLAEPESFANWLALPYSSFAVIKFLLSSLGFAWIVIGGVISLIAWAIRLTKSTRKTVTS
ncbi:MAG: hypothetical protein ACI93R_002022 [Flavobacteriales bacterium]|jgi:hypothetical protein